MILNFLSLLALIINFHELGLGDRGNLLLILTYKYKDISLNFKSIPKFHENRREQDKMERGGGGGGGRIGKKRDMVQREYHDSGM